jgi:hypothetical protein
MATATEISTRALRRAAVTDALESPSAVDIAHATEALTAMIASWESSWLSDDVLPLDGRYEQAVVAMLAVRICEEYGKAPGPVLLRDADDGWTKLQAAYFVVPQSRFETALKTTGANTQVAITDATTPDPYLPWQAATAYTERTLAINNFNLYEVKTSGTSASSGGPTGTGNAITDGTVMWVWRGVTGP